MRNSLRRHLMPALISAGLLAPSLLTAQPFVRNDLWWPRGTVTAIAKRGDTLYVGGTFSDFALIIGSYALLDPETGHFRSSLVEHSPDSTYYPQSPVSCVIPDGSGGWYLSLRYSGRVAHLLPDNTFASWNPGISGSTIYDIALSGSTLYVSGGFQSVQGKPRAGVVAVNTNSGHVTPWDPQVNGPVYDLLVLGSQVYLAGQFTSVRGQARSNLASIDMTTSTVSPWQPDPNGIVRALASSPEGLFVGGDFTTIAGAQQHTVVLVDPDSNFALPWTADLAGFRRVPSDSLDRITSITCTATQVVLAGGSNLLVLDKSSGHQVHDFVTCWGCGTIAEPPFRTGVACNGSTTTTATRVFVSTPQRLLCLDVETGRMVWQADHLGGACPMLALSGGKLFVLGAGSLTSVSNAHLAALNLRTGEPIPFAGDTDALVRGLLVSGNRLFINGDFTSIGNVGRNRVAAVDLISGRLSDWNPGADETVRCLALGPDGQMFLGGEFWSVGGAPRRYLAAVDTITGSVLSWRADADDWVMSMAQEGGTLYLGGWFTTLAGVARSYAGAVSAVTGSPQDWNPGADGPVLVVKLSGLGILLGGAFSVAGGVPRNGIAAIDGLAGTANPWAPGAYGTRTIEVTRDWVFVSSGSPVSRAFDGNGSIRPDWPPQVFYHDWGLGRRLTSIETIWADRDAVYLGGIGGVIAIMESSILAAPHPSPSRVMPGLAQNCPNPLRSQTRIRFSLARDASPRLMLLDIQGRRVRRILDGQSMAAGEHEVVVERHGLPDGLYWYRLEVDGHVETKRMVILD